MLLQELALRYEIRFENYLPVRPVGSSHEILEAVFLQFERFLSGEPARCHADILYMADLISLRETCIVHCTGIPEDKVAWLHVDLDQLTPTVLEPLDIFLVEEEEVHVL